MISEVFLKLKKIWCIYFCWKFTETEQNLNEKYFTNYQYQSFWITCTYVRMYGTFVISSWLISPLCGDHNAIQCDTIWYDMVRYGTVTYRTDLWKSVSEVIFLFSKIIIFSISQEGTIFIHSVKFSSVVISRGEFRWQYCWWQWEAIYELYKP